MAHPIAGEGPLIRADTLFLFKLTVGVPVDVGAVDGIATRCVPILGGTVSGAYDGMVLPGGADWQQIRPDGSLDIAARYVLDLSAGRVEVDSRGIRTASAPVLAKLAAGEIVDASQYYFRTFIRFRTASERLKRLNHIVAIAIGERLPNEVCLTVREVE